MHQMTAVRIRLKRGASVQSSFQHTKQLCAQRVTPLPSSFCLPTSYPPKGRYSRFPTSGHVTPMIDLLTPTAGLHWHAPSP